MGDILSRLRSYDGCYPGNVNIQRMSTDAADEIDALRKERDALRARVYVLKDALRDCHLHLREIYNNVSENDEEGALIERARAALEEK